MSVIVKGMDMPYGCANCSFVSEVTYDSKGWAKYFCKVDVDGVRGKSVTNEVISMNEGNLSATFPDWCPLEEADPVHPMPKPCEDCPLEPFAGSTFYGYRLEQLAKFAKLCESLGYTPQDIEDIHNDINRLYVDVLKRLNEEVRVIVQDTFYRPESPYDPIHRNPEDAYREDFGKESGNE